MAKSERQVELSVWIAGESGEGIVSLGEMITRACTRIGYQVFSYRTFPAEIRGGTVLFKLRIRRDPPLTPGDQADIMVALNQEGYDRYKSGMVPGSTLVYDVDSVHIDDTSDVRLMPVPFTHIATKEIGFRLAKNVVCFGSIWTALGGPTDLAEAFVSSQFERKGAEVVDLNLRAFRAGRDKIKELSSSEIEPLPVGDPVDAMLVTGNEAVALAGIASGLHLYAGYPITPASEIMETLAVELPRFGGHMIQAEDEIAALGMCIGASYAGHKAMTATSGPGLSLMVEQINLAGMAEIPVVIVDVQRGGPSTGMPTKTSQGDLNLAAYGVHNESPRVVLAPISVEDCFYTTIEAFNISERYQVPVIILSEQALSASKVSVPRFDPDRVPRWERKVVPDGWLGPNGSPSESGYVLKRYENTPDGISPMPRPGTPGLQYTATGLEHNEHGDPAYSPEATALMSAKRFRKLSHLLEHHADEFVYTFGEEGHADLGVIAWGSCVAPVREALEAARDLGMKVALLAPKMVHPLPVAQIERFAERVDRLIAIEMNWSGQLANMVRAQCCLPVRSFTRDTGMPIEPATALEYIRTAYAKEEAHV